MRRANVEAVQGVYERWSRGDFAASLDVFDPEVVFVVRSPLPEAGRYEGLASVRDYTRGFLEPWSRITIEAEEYTPAGDRVLVTVRQRGEGGGSGVVTELRYFHVWSFRDGRAVGLESIHERAEALEAAGLGE
jgi:ketosteroid isomerase-like protein